MAEGVAEAPKHLFGMRVNSLEFHRFRNYEALRLNDMSGLTVFVGHNAVGKTNILEGIQLLTSAYSFRHPRVAQLIRDGDEHARIALHASDGNRALDVALSFEPGKKRYSVNGKSKSAADVRGKLPSILFTPDDLQLVKRSSSVKRTAIDNLGMQLTRNYYIVRNDYEKTIRYKNKLLKEEASDVLIESINETLVTCGAQLFCLRTALFERMMPAVLAAYEQLAGGGEVFSATYCPSWERMSTGRFEYPSSRDEVRDVLARELERWFGEERRRCRCLIGPHNDELLFYLDGRDAALYGSQGQQRSIVLAWKLAEVEMVREIMGIQPLLLLDDVLSELDSGRREMLVKFVTDEIQTFITATDLSGFDESFINKAHVVRLPLEARE